MQVSRSFGPLFVLGLLSAAGLAASAGRSISAAERSLVGGKLRPVTFVDTEGHTINPSHYQGSVLVMMAGIPW